jgi:hypothetical protein
MSTPIQPYRTGAAAYAAGSREARPQPDRTGAFSRPAAPDGLSPSESQMIEKVFPESPAITLRLYGPGRSSTELNPASLGGRLDLRG